MTRSARVAALFFSALPGLISSSSGKEESTSFFKKNESNGFGGGGRGTTFAKKIRLIEKKTHHHHHHRCLSGCVCVSFTSSSAKAHRHQKCCSSMTTSFFEHDVRGDKGRRNSRKTRFLKNKRAGVASNKHNAVASLNAAAMGLANNNNNIIMAQTSLFNLGVNELAWLLSTLYALFCFSICVRAKRGDEKAIANIRNYSTLVPLAVFYGVLLIRSWSDIYARIDDAGEFRGRTENRRSAIYTETQRHQRTALGKSRVGVRLGALYARQSLRREARDVAKFKVRFARRAHVGALSRHRTVGVVVARGHEMDRFETQNQTFFFGAKRRKRAIIECDDLV